MQLSIPSKLPGTGTTIFTTMSVLSAQHNAVNLGQGFPDFPMNSELVSLVNEAMTTGQNQYTHMNGLPALRNGIAEKCNALYGCNINPDTEITVTPGATYAIYTALTALLQPGDEVIVFDPSYDSYEAPILLSKAHPIRVAMNDDYTPNWERIEKACSAKTKMIIINNPHNPTGKILSHSDFEALEILLEKTHQLQYIVNRELVFDASSKRLSEKSKIFELFPM